LSANASFQVLKARSNFLQTLLKGFELSFRVCWANLLGWMLQPEQYWYRFGDFELDPFNRRLIRSGTNVPVSPKPFDILLVLLERHGQIVAKEVLLERVWPDTFVEEATLAQHVHTLRKVLGCGAENKKYIDTVPGRGYCFLYPVELQAAGAAGAHKNSAASSEVGRTREYVDLVSRIFDDPNSLTTKTSEGTLLTMGRGPTGWLLVVEHTLQENSEQATIAILSVRKATTIEGLFYGQRRPKADDSKKS